MDKTNLNANWQRIASVIRWSNMTINHFAKHIGLSRAENLYQIKNGNNGISQKLARRIVEFFPEISVGWLLSGEGTMFHEDKEVGIIPYYSELGKFLSYCRGEQSAPDKVLSFAPAADAEVAVVVDGGVCMTEFCNAIDDVTAKKSIFLKKIEAEGIIPSSFYMILTANFVYLRKVTAVLGDESKSAVQFDKDEKSGCTIILDTASADANVMLPSGEVALSDVKAAYKVVGVFSPMQ